MGRLSHPARLRQLVIAGVFLAGLAVATIAGEPVTVVLYLPHAAVGAFLAIRRPGNVVGWLLIVFGWSQCLGTLRIGASAASLADATAPLSERLAASATGTLWSFAFVAFVGLAFLFPDGRLPPGRLRHVARANLGGTTLLALVITFNPTVNVLLPTGDVDMPNVFSPFPALSGFPGGSVLFPLFALPGIVALWWTTSRYRRAVGLERLQVRWLAAALALVAIVSTVWVVLVVVVGGEATSVGWIMVVIGYPAVPMAIAIAVMRYRLFEIDRIISRTVSWTLVSATLAALFAGLVVGLQSLLAPIAGGSSIAVAGSTLIVFAASQPVRRRVQLVVDRRFNRTGTEAALAAERFAADLRDETDLTRISSRLLAAVNLAVAPSPLRLWIRPVPEARPAREQW